MGRAMRTSRSKAMVALAIISVGSVVGIWVGVAVGEPPGAATGEDQPPPATQRSEAAERRAQFDERFAVNYEVLAFTVRQELQSRLADRGFYDGPIDGEIGPATLEAISHFQWSQGLEPTGYVDAATSRALGMDIFVEPPPAQPMRDPRPGAAPPSQGHP
jgi:hypothetical protein